MNASSQHMNYIVSAGIHPYAAMGLPRRSDYSMATLIRRQRLTLQESRRYLASVIYRASDIIANHNMTRERSERDIPGFNLANAMVYLEEQRSRSGEGTRAAQIFASSVRMHAYRTPSEAREACVYKTLQRSQREQEAICRASVSNLLDDHLMHLRRSGV